MARRKMADPCTEPINMRITKKMKTEVDSLADSMRITTNDFIRMALQEKINRVNSEREAESARAAVPAGMEDQLRQIVWSCLNEAGLPYKKDGSAAADKERSEK